jgi:hypothetical protein
MTPAEALAVLTPGSLAALPPGETRDAVEVLRRAVEQGAEAETRLDASEHLLDEHERVVAVLREQLAEAERRRDVLRDRITAGLRKLDELAEDGGPMFGSDLDIVGAILRGDVR